MSLLSVTSVVAGYGEHDQILKGVDIEVAEGEIVAILGPNGAGKSTLLKTIAGIVRPRSGIVAIGGDTISGLPPREISRRGVVFVPQEANVFPSMTIEENLEIGAYVDRRKLSEQLPRIYERIPELASKRRAKAGALSGGQRQLLAMGMALMVEPRLMLLDEPTAGLSPAAAENLFAMVRSISADGVSIAMVEQNALHALMISDRAYILVDGCNARDGNARAIAEDPEIRRIFLGADKAAAPRNHHLQGGRDAERPNAR
jgi:branched-chain amino acid transport system ATP-binding protein/neutral amino acid transport system ATP-binding protein